MFPNREQIDDKAKLVVREMTDILALDLVEKRIVTDQLTLNIAYDVLNLTDPHSVNDSGSDCKNMFFVVY